MPAFQIQLLGNFQLLYDGKPVTNVTGTRVQSLLAYLILHAEAPQPRRQLAFLLWPASSESQAHSNLRKLFAQLRQVLPAADQFLRSDRQMLQWNSAASCRIDVDELDQLLQQMEQAPLDQCILTSLIELYTGELLPGCYEDWILPLRQKYQQGIQQALAWLVTLLENQRAYAEAARYAQRLLDLDPFDETNYQRLMRLQALLGNRSGAVRIYHDCVKRLQQELEVEPSQKTQQLYTWILNLALGAQTPTSEQPVVADRVSFVGRAVEWQQLLAAWQRTTQGHSHLVLINGEAGIGKTRLAEELLQWVAYHGILVARTRSYAAQGDLTYAPLIELLRTDALRGQLAKLSNVWLVEVGRLLPELLTSRATLAQLGPLTENWQRQRFLEALARAVLGEEQPLLLLFDDLQWCDQETMRWLRYLLHYAPQARLLVVGTVRPEEVDLAHPLTALQVDLRRSDQLTEIALPALSQDEVTTLAAQLSETAFTPQEGDQLYRETEGNPLFVVETVRAGFNPGAKEQSSGEASSAISRLHPTSSPLPPKVFTIILSRLAQLSPQAQELVRLAAAIGRSFTFAVLAAASNQDEETLVNSLDELWRRRVVRDHGTSSYDFSHDRIREVAYAELSPTRQRWFHHRIAGALESIYASRLQDVCGPLAVHYEQAGQPEKAIGYYQQAAEMARQMHANSDAIGHFRKALALLQHLPAMPDRPLRELHLLLGLGPTLKDAKGDAATAVEEVYDHARQLSQQLGHVPEIMPILQGLTELYRVRAMYLKAFEIGQQLLALADQFQTSEALANVYFQLGATFYNCGELTAARSYLEQSIASCAFPYAYLKPHTRLAQLFWQIGYPEQALQRCQEILRLDRGQMRPTAVTDLLGDTIEVRLLCGELHTAREDCEEMLSLAHKYELDEPMTWATYLQGWALALQGQPAGILQMQQGLASYLATGGMTGRTRFLSLLAEMSLQMGESEQAIACLDEADALIQRTGERYWEAELYRLKGQWLLAQRSADQTEAEVCFQRALNIARQQQAKSLELRAAVCLSRLWQSQGRRTAARAVLTEVYNWFQEGFGLRELQAAKALLEALC